MRHLVSECKGFERATLAILKPSHRRSLSTSPSPDGKQARTAIAMLRPRVILCFA